MKEKFTIFLFFLSMCHTYAVAHDLQEGTPLEGDTIQEKMNWLKSNVIPVLNVDYNKAVDDFQCFENLIGNKRIIFLGEQSHYDGTTKKFKFKLIKYLHEKMGFNILIDELPLSRTYWVGEACRNKTDFILGNSYGLPFNEVLHNFYSYVHSSQLSDQQLEYYGLDIDPLESKEYYERELEAVDRTLLLTSEWQRYMSLIDLIYQKKGMQVEIKEMKELVDYFISKIDTTDKLDVRRKLFLSKIFLDSYNFVFHLKSIPPFFFEKVYSGVYGTNENEMIFEGLRTRDSLMAENFFWLCEKIIPKDQKIIVTTSSYHICKNIDEIAAQSQNLEKAKPMGEYICNRYRDEVYSLAFVRYKGFTGILEKYDSLSTVFVNGSEMPAGSMDSSRVRSISKAPVGSIEELLNSIKIKYALLDLSNAEKSSWLRRSNTMSPSFSSAYSVDWSEVYDGIFFIRDMEPIQKVPYEKFFSPMIRNESLKYLGFAQSAIIRKEKISRKEKRQKKKINRKLMKDWKKDRFN